MLKNIAIGIGMLIVSGIIAAAAFGAELSQGEHGKTFGWQERARVCAVGMSVEKCAEYVRIQIGGGDGAAGESGDAGAAAGSGDSGGDGCGR